MDPGAPAGKQYQTTSVELPLPWWQHVCGRGRKTEQHQQQQELTSTKKKKAVPSIGSRLSAPPSLGSCSWPVRVSVLVPVRCPVRPQPCCPVSRRPAHHPRLPTEPLGVGSSWLQSRQPPQHLHRCLAVVVLRPRYPWTSRSLPPTPTPGHSPPRFPSPDSGPRLLRRGRPRRAPTYLLQTLSPSSSLATL
jgi:hypothetical protein